MKRWERSVTRERGRKRVTNGRRRDGRWKDENKDKEACKRVIFSPTELRQMGSPEERRHTSWREEGERGVGLNDENWVERCQKWSRVWIGKEEPQDRRVRGEQVQSLSMKTSPSACQLLLHNDFSHSASSLYYRVYSARLTAWVKWCWPESWVPCSTSGSHKVIHYESTSRAQGRIHIPQLGEHAVAASYSENIRRL